MALYKATKNIYFTSLNKSVIVDEIIDLEKEYAEAVNADLKPIFPDVAAALVPIKTTEPVADAVDEPSEIVVADDDKPKKSTRKKKDVDETPDDEATELVADATDEK
jgi:hypothetical protein